MEVAYTAQSSVGGSSPIRHPTLLIPNPSSSNHMQNLSLCKAEKKSCVTHLRLFRHLFFPVFIYICVYIFFVYIIFMFACRYSYSCILIFVFMNIYLHIDIDNYSMNHWFLVYLVVLSATHCSLFTTLSTSVLVCLHFFSTHMVKKSPSFS